MLNRLDYIIKKVLNQIEAHHTPDWEVFYPLLRAEEGMPADEENVTVDDQDQAIYRALDDLDYSGPITGWTLFETRLDELNDSIDADFDQKISESLEGMEVNALDESGWHLFENRLDALNVSMDADFDQTISDGLKTLPDTAWNESHWLLLSNRLDAINDRPRILMMKVAEAAAVLFILIQLSSLYSEFQLRNGSQDSILSYFENVFGSRPGEEVVVPPNTFPSGYPEHHALVDSNTTSKNDLEKQLMPLSGKSELQSEQKASTERDATISAAVDFENEIYPVEGIVDHLPLRAHKITYSQLEEPTQLYEYEFFSPVNQLESSPPLITYNELPGPLANRISPRLGMRDMSLLTAALTDSILNSIPTLQVIKPRIYSAMEVGALADVTKVNIQQAFAVPGAESSFQDLTLNPGLYFRYKIQYQDVFGAIGADFVQLKYAGRNHPNELALLTLPFELGYNLINLSSFRLFVSGGVAGRFVPVADYSSDTYNLASDYSLKSNKKSNGLFYNGPFDINSYLSARMSMGFDVNVNKSTSIGLRFTHDMWLKGRGIGYNQDKFRSSHIALGTSYHF